MKRLAKLIKWSLILAFSGGLLGVAALGVSYLIISPGLPDVEVLREVQLQVPLRVYSRNGKLMQVFGEKRRNPVPIADIPDRLKHAFLAGEDARFYEHPGVDYQGIARAIWHIIKTGGEKGPGGSTITQQLGRDFGFVSRKKLYTRKLKEWFLALKIERELTKDEILELYLNKIYLGNRAYGVAAAAQAYYGKTLNELTLAEAAMIAALPKAPSRINPINSPERAVDRRNYVLGQMLEHGYIDQREYAAAVAAADFAYAHEPTVEVDAPYAAEMVRHDVLNILGPDAYTGGYRVYTTFDDKLQQVASRAVQRGLIEYDRRHGYRGPEARFDLSEVLTPAEWAEILDRFVAIGGIRPALVTAVEDDFALAYLSDGQTISLDFEDMSWARPYLDTNTRGPTPASIADVVAVGDVVRVARGDQGGWQLSQLPQVEGALVSLSPEDGAILAVVGGFDFARSKFNRAIQARRQPGSSFKPFVYAAALDRGYTPATLVNDAPVVFDDEQLERTWKPENFSEKFFGLTRLREGMVNSRNLVSIRVVRDIGVGYTREFTYRFGFQPQDIPADLSMALGSGAVPPLSMARAYATLANGGYLVDPYFITRIVDGQGHTVYQAQPVYACADCAERIGARGSTALAADLDTETAAQMAPRLAPRVIDPETHYLLHSLLLDVVRRGTGRNAMALGRGDLAGKTGTTNEQRDAWFSGFNHAVVTTAWVGFDQFEPMGTNEVGGRAALPVWMEYMRAALEQVPERLPPLPEGVVFARINPENGRLCGVSTVACIQEVFRKGQLPPPEDESTRARGEEIDPYGIF